MATFAQKIVFGPFFSGGTLQTTNKLYHYAAGTTTLKSVWSDRAKVTTLPQPLTPDANGLFEFFADGLYKFQHTDTNDVVINTFDNFNVTDQDPSGEGAAIASASTLTLGTDGDFFHVTGTTTIAQLSGTQASVTLVFDGILTLTHSANLIIRKAVNYTTKVGDVLRFVNEGSGVWRESNLHTSTTETVEVQGQCYLSKSSTNLLLSRENGRFITLKTSGVWTRFEVPSSGPTLAPTSLSMNTNYYIYAFDSSGTITLEASATAYATDADTGFKIKTGDATRLLVGFARTNGSTAWVDDTTSLYVLSFYNRTKKVGISAFASDRTTSSTSYVEVNSEIRVNFLVFSGDVVEIKTSGDMGINATNTARASIGIDSASPEDVSSATESPTGVSLSGSAVTTKSKSGLTEAEHYATFLGLVTAGTATYKGNASANGIRCTVQVTLKG